MKRILLPLSCVMILGVALWSSGIVPAIIPQAVPTANKIGNSTKFQLGASGAVSGDCPTFDANLNITGPGTGTGCASVSTSSGGLTVYSGTAGISLSGTVFFPVGGGSAASTTETTVDADVQASTTISRFGANISTALGMSNSVVFTWRKNGADTTLTCTISGASATSCGDAVNNFSIVPGDLLAVKAVFSGTIVVTPTFVLTAQTGTLLSGTVASATQFQVGEYLTAGTTISGVSIPNCPDSAGNHVNFASGTGVFTCGTSGSGGNPGGSANQLQYQVNGTTFGGVGSYTLPNVSTTGGSVTSLPTSGWTIVNGALLNDFSTGITGVHIIDNNALNWRFIKRTITVPYTLIAEFYLSGGGDQIGCSTQTGGIYLTDGTKLEGIESIAQQNTAVKLRVETITNVNTDSATVAGPTSGIIGKLIAIKIVNNSTTRVFSYWTNGAWVQFLSESSGTFLTENAVGPGGLSACNNAAVFVYNNLVYWSQ